MKKRLIRNWSVAPHSWVVYDIHGYPTVITTKEVRLFREKERMRKLAENIDDRIGMDEKDMP